jgi:hypothetical protein
MIDSITRLDAPPEMKLAAAVVRSGSIACRAGDGESCSWLASDACRAWLAIVAPTTCDPTDLQRLLIARSRPARIRPRQMELEEAA